MKVMFAYWTGLLPYLHIDREALMLPYMTRDFIKMKEIEREQAKSFFSRIFLTLYIYIGQLANMTFNPALLHLQRRGIYTSYWVLNEVKELNFVIHKTRIDGVMTDKPAVF